MFKVFKYSFIDLVRNRWTIAYFLFFALISSGLIFISGDSTKTMASMMNIIVLLIPLISLMFSLMYFYQVLEYIELLLSMPLSRRAVWAGYWAGASLALSLSFLSGTLIPIILLGFSFEWKAWSLLILLGCVLTVLFVSIAALLSIRFENRLKGFGIALFIWLFLAVVYDGLFLVALLLFANYPLENFAITAVLLNPIDMARILMILHLDFSALMGYTGAVFEKFFGETSGTVLILTVLFSWFLLILGLLNRRLGKKDF